MATTAIDSLRGILNGFRDLNSKGIYPMNATETDLLRKILIEVQALSLGGGIADGSVTTPKIADLNVTTPKLADNSVATAKIPDSAVTTSKIPDANITAPKLSGAQTGSAPVFGIRAWVNFNGTGTVAINGSGNVSSITDNGVGDYTVNFTTALPNANYSAMGVSNAVNATNAQGVVNLYSTNTDGTGLVKTTSACRILVANASAGSPVDYGQVSVAFVG